MTAKRLGRRPSTAMLLILRELVDAGEVELHGYRLMQRTGLRSGSLYPALANLRERGWIASREVVDGTRAPGRPPRVLHRLTPDGLKLASEALAPLQGPVPRGLRTI